MLINILNKGKAKMLSLSIIFLIFINGGTSRNFSTCELVQELRRQNIPENQLEDCKFNRDHK